MVSHVQMCFKDYNLIRSHGKVLNLQMTSFLFYEIELTLWKQRQKLILFLLKLLWTCNCPTNECESFYSLVAMNSVEYFKDHMGDNCFNSCWLSWRKPVGIDKDLFQKIVRSILVIDESGIILTTFKSEKRWISLCRHAWRL